jgi:hypothetical protein
VTGGNLQIHRNPEAPTTCAATIWYRPDLPPGLLIRFRARPVPPAKGNYANLNLFLCAREADGSELRFGRSGRYAHYHEIPNYIVTFVGGESKGGWSRVRRDPGFRIVSESPIRSEVGTEYFIVVTLCDGVLRYYIDGKRIHRFADPDPLPAGKFGLRTFRTDGWWDDVDIGRVLSIDETTTSPTDRR